MLPIERKVEMNNESDMSWLDEFCKKLSPEECAYLRSKLDEQIGLEDEPDGEDEVIPLGMDVTGSDAEDSEEE